MTWLLALDMATGTLVLLLAACVAYGFARGLRFGGPPQRRLMQVGLVATMICLTLRPGWHDVLRPILGMAGWLAWDADGRSTVTALFNAASNGVGIVAQLAFLGVLYHSIPPQDRGRYSWLTGWRYPPTRRRWLVGRRRALPPTEDMIP